MPEQYTIGSGLSEQEMQIASFWVRHQILLRKIGYGSLIALSSLLWLYVLWSLLDAYAISYPREQRIPGRIIQNALSMDSLLASAPKSAQISEVSIFDITDGRQDMLVEVTNPNDKWSAVFDYSFEIAGERTTTRSGYLLPFSRKYLTELGFKSKERSRQARLIVEKVRWQRINPSEVDRDYKTFAERRLSISVEDAKYESNLPLDSRSVGRTSFTLVNASAYGFWKTELTVVLFRGETAVGVTTLGATELKPGERRPISIDWFDNLSGVSKTEVRVDTNILEPDNYLPTTRF